MEKIFYIKLYDKNNNFLGYDSSESSEKIKISNDLIFYGGRDFFKNYSLEYIYDKNVIENYFKNFNVFYIKIVYGFIEDYNQGVFILKENIKKERIAAVFKYNPYLINLGIYELIKTKK